MVDLDDYPQRVKFFVSTKAELLEEKVNKWLEEHEEVDVLSIQPFMSYSSIKDKGAYMIGCMLHYFYNENTYIEEVNDGIPS